MTPAGDPERPDRRARQHERMKEKLYPPDTNEQDQESVIKKQARTAREALQERVEERRRERRREQLAKQHKQLVENFYPKDAQAAQDSLRLQAAEEKMREEETLKHEEEALKKGPVVLGGLPGDLQVLLGGRTMDKKTSPHYHTLFDMAFDLYSSDFQEHEAKLHAEKLVDFIQTRLKTKFNVDALELTPKSELHVEENRVFLRGFRSTHDGTLLEEKLEA